MEDVVGDYTVVKTVVILKILSTEKRTKNQPYASIRILSEPNRMSRARNGEWQPQRQWFGIEWNERVVRLHKVFMFIKIFILFVCVRT